MEKNVFVKTHDSKASNYEYSYFLADNYEFFHSTLMLATPVEKREIGELFCEILNVRQAYYDFFEEYLSKIGKCEHFEEIEEIRKEIIERSHSELDLFSNPSFLIFHEVTNIITKVDNEYTEKKLKDRIEYKKKYIEQDKSLLKKENENELMSLYWECENVEHAKELKKINIQLNEEELKRISRDINIVKREETIDRIKKVYTEIRETLEFFNKYLIEKDKKEKEEIKIYLLWGNVIPKCFNRMLEGDQLTYSSFFQWFQERKVFEKLKPVKEYRCTTMRELLYLYIDIYFDNKFRINICENCGKYFVVNVRGDKKYCDNIYKNGLKCGEYAPKYNFNNKEITKKYNKLVNRYRSKINNNKNKNRKEIQEFTKELNIFKDTFTKNKELVKKQKISEKEFNKWIDTQIKEYEKKYFKK